MALDVVQLWESGLDTYEIAKQKRRSGFDVLECDVEREVNRHLDDRHVLHQLKTGIVKGGEIPCLP